MASFPVELTGELRCSRSRRLRRGVGVTAMLLDIGDPLPSHETWALHVIDESSSYIADTGEPLRFYKMKSGARPKALAEVPEGATVTIRATVSDWGNGLGGYLSHVRLLAMEPVQ